MTKLTTLENLTQFLTWIRKQFAAITHSHKLSDITDYTVDSELSAESANPIENQAVSVAIASVTDEISALETSVNKLDTEKADRIVATSEADGLMSSADKSKLDGLASSEILYTTFTASGWSGSASPYTQTISVEGITAEDDVYIDRSVDYTASEATITAYNKAFGIIGSGVGQTIDGGIEWKVFKKPEIDVTVAITYAEPIEFDGSGSGSGGSVEVDLSGALVDVEAENGVITFSRGDGTTKEVDVSRNINLTINEKGHLISEVTE